MIGAGLIKIRSQDRKWKDLTAMNYFYETQPLPNPLSKYFHYMPSLWHKVEVILNYTVELITPWLLILPGLPVPIRRAGGIVQLIFQSVLVACGNLSFLNWLTMVPAIMCLVDALLRRFLTPIQQDALRTASASSWLYISVNREVVSITFSVLILVLSRPVITNLLSSNQVMNRSYDPYQLVNTYGAFGTVNEDRVEYIISSACSWDGDWREYEFIAKPVNIYRSPIFLSPFHYRLDWQMWLAANYGRIDCSPWMYSFLVKLLERDAGVLSLMQGDPWEDSLDPPRYIRIQRYRYRYYKSSRDEKYPPYWDRELIGNVYPMNGLATLSDLKAMIPKG
jgi:lipase maturation factor 1